MIFLPTTTATRLGSSVFHSNRIFKLSHIFKPSSSSPSDVSSLCAHVCSASSLRLSVSWTVRFSIQILRRPVFPQPFFASYRCVYVLIHASSDITLRDVFGTGHELRIHKTTCLSAMIAVCRVRKLYRPLQLRPTRYEAVSVPVSAQASVWPCRDRSTKKYPFLCLHICLCAASSYIIISL